MKVKIADEVDNVPIVRLSTLTLCQGWEFALSLFRSKSLRLGEKTTLFLNFCYQNLHPCHTVNNYLNALKFSEGFVQCPWTHLSGKITEFIYIVARLTPVQVHL